MREAGMARRLLQEEIREKRILANCSKRKCVQLYNKFKNMNLDENELRTQITKVYDKLESLGITKDDVKGVIGKLIDIAKSLLN